MTPLVGIDTAPENQAALTHIPFFGNKTTAEHRIIQDLADRDPLKREVDLVEETWRYHLAKDTPNGHLFSENNFYDDVRTGEPLTLIHATPALGKIIDSGSVKISGGCLGASIYTAPQRQDGRMHNLLQFVKEDQMEGNPISPKKTDLLLVEFPPQEFRKDLINGVDYLLYGPMQWKAFKRLHEERNIPDDVTREIITHFEEQLTPETIDFLKLCSRYDEIGTIPTAEFEEAFRMAQGDFKYLGYPLFEAMTEYVALYQNDDRSQKLMDEGELNTYNYFNLAFKARPELYKHFSLKWFNPSFSEMSQSMQDMAEEGKGILDFDPEHFAEFMKWRVAQQVRKSVGLEKDGEIIIPEPIHDRDSLMSFGDQIPGLAGHITHRALRANHDWEPDHHYYETVRATTVLSHWDEKGTVFVANSILPKGEVGFNIGATPETTLEHTIYLGEAGKDGIVRKVSEDPLPIQVEPSVARANMSTLRPHTGT